MSGGRGYRFRCSLSIHSLAATSGPHSSTIRHWADVQEDPSTTEVRSGGGPGRKTGVSKRGTCDRATPAARAASCQCRAHPADLQVLDFGLSCPSPVLGCCVCVGAFLGRWASHRLSAVLRARSHPRPVYNMQRHPPTTRPVPRSCEGTQRVTPAPVGKPVAPNKSRPLTLPHLLHPPPDTLRVVGTRAHHRRRLIHVNIQTCAWTIRQT